MDKILDVPYYRQNEPGNGLNEFWQNRSCGILAIRMVVDYYRIKKHQEPIKLTELFDRTLKAGGVNDAGNWLHSALVESARTYGLIAWRRNWRLSSYGTKMFKKEGADAETLKIVDVQQSGEAIPTLISFLMQDYPVIISVAKNFDEIERPHLVVMTGFRIDKNGRVEGIYYNDPYTPSDDRKNGYVDIERFQNRWNFRAIFVKPKESIS